MGRWTDTKGSSLGYLTAFDEANLADLRQAAALLAEHAPGTQAAVRVQRVVALVEAAFAEMDGDAGGGAGAPLYDLLHDMGHALENGSGAAAAVKRGLDPREALSDLAPGSEVDVMQVVREGEEALRKMRELRDALLVRGRP